MRLTRLAAFRVPVRAWTASVRARSDAGSASTELVVATPLLFLMVMLVIQAGLWMHATHIAQAGANAALTSAAAQGSNAARGQADGRQTLDALGRTLLRDPKVEVTRTATTVTVAVTATAPAVVPGLHWPVKASAVGPVERFVPDGRQP